MATDVERLRDSWADLIEQNEGWLDYRPAPSEGAQMQDVIAQASLPVLQSVSHALVICLLALLWRRLGCFTCAVSNQAVVMLSRANHVLHSVAAGQGGAGGAAQALPDPPRPRLPPRLSGFQPGGSGILHALVSLVRVQRV